MVAMKFWPYPQPPDLALSNTRDMTGTGIQMFTAIDLFAGLGGWSTGARDAGAQVLWAANHWPDAVEWHTANHPDTQHICQDLHQADWSQVPKHD